MIIIIIIIIFFFFWFSLELEPETSHNPGLLPLELGRKGRFSVFDLEIVFYVWG